MESFPRGTLLKGRNGERIPRRAVARRLMRPNSLQGKIMARQRRLCRRARVDIANELIEIRTTILNLLWKAEEALEGTGMTKDRADAYWLYHIRDSLGDDGNRYTYNIQNTIDELLGEEDEDD